MSIPDFERAEYHQPPVIDGATGYVETPRQPGMAALPLALMYGVAAAIVGAAAYAAIAMTGFMVSIVSIGIGYIVARAMMTATRGFGGRKYQIAAVVLTYLSCTLGSLCSLLLREHVSPLVLLNHPEILPQLVSYLLFGPFLRFMNSPLWAAMGLLILFYGLRTAWQMAAGSPGFGQQGGPRMTFMGLRR